MRYLNANFAQDRVRLEWNEESAYFIQSSVDVVCSASALKNYPYNHTVTGVSKAPI